MSFDVMTPLQRMAAYNKGEMIDRLPCVPIVGNTAARVIGVKVSEFKGNGNTGGDYCRGTVYLPRHVDNVSVCFLGRP